MWLWQKRSRRRVSIRGFSIVQTMIAALITSALGAGMATYMKRSNVNLRDSDLSEEITQSGQFISKALENDLSQVAFVNPLHTTNNPLSVTGVSTTAAQIIIRGGIVPLPGLTKEGVEALTSFGIPANLTSAASTLSSTPNDSVRLVLFDFSTTMNCRLSAWHVGNNPSTTAESLWLDSSNCSGVITPGKLYLITQSWEGGTSSFLNAHSNLFQATTVYSQSNSESSKSSYYEIKVDHVSTSGNRWNQTGGLGLSGYTKEARIFPVKLVEWGVSSSGGLYRREISPTAGNLVGTQSWVNMQADVEGIQFYPMTGTGTGGYEHQRTMQFTTDTSNDGLEDVRGVSPRFSIKSRRASPDPNKTYHNPLLTSYTSDSFPRLEIKFFVAMRNRGD